MHLNTLAKYASVALGFLLLSGCGPTNAEISASIALTLPLMLLVGSGVLAICERFATGQWPPSTFWNRALKFAVALSLFGLGAAFTQGHEAFELAPLAFGLVGASWLSFGLLVWRVRLGVRLRRIETNPFGRGAWGATILLLPSIPIGFMTDGKGTDLLLMAWIYAGGGGATPAVLLSLLGGEAAVRAWLRRTS